MQLRSRALARPRARRELRQIVHDSRRRALRGSRHWPGRQVPRGRRGQQARRRLGRSRPGTRRHLGCSIRQRALSGHRVRMIANRFHTVANARFPTGASRSRVVGNIRPLINAGRLPMRRIRARQGRSVRRAPVRHIPRINRAHVRRAELRRILRIKMARVRKVRAPRRMLRVTRALPMPRGMWARRTRVRRDPTRCTIKPTRIRRILRAPRCSATLRQPTATVTGLVTAGLVRLLLRQQRLCALDLWCLRAAGSLCGAT